MTIETHHKRIWLAITATNPFFPWEAYLMQTFAAILCGLMPAISLASALTLDERPAADQEWGYRPAAGAVLAASPPGFCWRPQKGIVA
jgi:hypothetical protein